MKSNKCRKEKCLDFRLFIAIAKNHTVNHTSNEEWGFPRHVHARKPHSGIRLFCLQLQLEFCCLDGYIHLISTCRVLSWITSSRQSLGLYKPPSSFPYLLTLTYPICRMKIWVLYRTLRFVVFSLLSYRVFLWGFPNRQCQHHIVGLHFFGQPSQIFVV